MSRAGDVDFALAYGLARYRGGASGKTLMVGWRGDVPLMAVAAGLSSDQDRDRFAALSRYLLRRDKADGYWLIAAADVGDRPHMVVEQFESGRRQVTAFQLDVVNDAGVPGERRSLAAEALLGELLDRSETLPAIMRRELDRLAARCAIVLPDV